ncbi:MAG: ATP synthase F0 subunit B [Bdellovibrionaceae bacterium]|nr:ATP synthase F0 subunit B [Bdellovibrio sp.]
MKKTFMVTFLLSAVAMALEAAGHGEGHNAIPFEQIGWQAANLGILLIALFFFLRKSVIEAFANRRTAFLSQAEKTKAALKNAEAALQEIKTKLATLESGEGKAIENAKHESNLAKAHIIHESEVHAEKMKADLQLTLKNELEKAKSEINNLILTQAISFVTKKINDKSSQVSQGAEAAFLNQISQVKS